MFHVDATRESSCWIGGNCDCYFFLLWNLFKEEEKRHGALLIQVNSLNVNQKIGSKASRQHLLPDSFVIHCVLSSLRQGISIRHWISRLDNDSENIVGKNNRLFGYFSFVFQMGDSKHSWIRLIQLRRGKWDYKSIDRSNQIMKQQESGHPHLSAAPGIDQWTCGIMLTILDTTFLVAWVCIFPVSS